MIQEYAVRNPMSGIVMTVPDNSQANAEKMAAYVPGSLVMTRMVTDWVVNDSWPNPTPTHRRARLQPFRRLPRHLCEPMHLLRRAIRTRARLRI